MGVTERPADEYDFKEKLIELNTELDKLNKESKTLETKISHNVRQIIGRL